MLRLFPLFFILSLLGVHLRADDSTVGANELPGDFESGESSYNPWAGVDDEGYLHVIAGSQLATSDSGVIGNEAFSPSVAVGDLNGDGLPDLVVADARGYFWYFPNSGKPGAPAFTHGEVMPLWLGGGEGEGDAVPLIQLVDYSQEKKLSIVAGNYLGGLYLLHNDGSAMAPVFHMRPDRAELEIPTHKGKSLWCNYLAPFLYDWSGTGRLDLLVGDGSYSANSIYLFKNVGSNDRPSFNEDNEVKIIPGMGREHLTPQVVDWNNDGKPDVICGERTGCIDVYLNQAADRSSPPVFDKDHQLKVAFGDTETVGALTTVCAADLNHDNLFDLVVSSVDGRISYAPNIGSAGSPKFGPLVPLKGVYPYAKVIKPRKWAVDRFRPDGLPYELLECTNASVEPGFTPPPAPFSGKGALKFSMVQPNNVYFPQVYRPVDDTRTLIYSGEVYIEAEVSYTISMWVKTVGNVSGFTWHIEGNQGIDQYTQSFHGYTGSTWSGSATWNKVDAEIRIPRTVDDNPDRKTEAGYFSFRLLCHGEGTLYLDDIALTRNP